MAHLFCSCWPTFLMIFVAVTGFGHQISQSHGHMHFIVVAVANSAKTVAPGSGGTVAPKQQSSKCCRRANVTARHRNATACTFRQQIAQTVLDYVALPQQLSQSSANHSIISSRSIRTRRQLRANSVAHRHPQHAKLSSKSDNMQLAGTMQFNQSVGVEQQPLRRFVHELPSPPVPAAWWEACAAISATGLSGLQMQLHPHECTLPDVQQSSVAHCQLGRQPWAYTFADPALSVFVSSLFLSIAQGWAALAKQLGAPAPQLNRFDLFHGHIFIANDCNNTATALQCNCNTNWNSSILQYSSLHHSSNSAGSSSSSMISTDQHKRTTTSSRTGRGGCRVGVLFHASEYPAYDESAFPIMLGHCQANSSCRYDQRAMDLRNILWWQGQLAILDVGETSPLHDLLLHEGTEPLRTVYEEDFGKPVADLLLLHPPHHRRRRRMAAELQRWGRLLQAEAAGGRSSCNSTQHHGVFVSY